MEDFFQRPWGGYTILRDQQEHGWALKTLFVHPRAQLSVQRHKLRDETWILVQGSGWSGEGYPVRWTPLDSTKPVRVPRGVIHSLRAGPDQLIIVETMIGVYKEEDIERFGDIYGRETVQIEGVA